MYGRMIATMSDDEGTAGRAGGRRTRTDAFGPATEADLPEFLAADEGEAAPLKRVRAPNDPLPYDADEEEGPCFASQYQADGDDGDGLGASELKHAFRSMHELIDRYHASNTSNADLVDAVHAFYEKNIRAMYEYPMWSRKSIWKYVSEHSENALERQCVENIKTVYRQIEFLRDHVATKNEVTGCIEPDLRVIREVGTLAKLHAALVGDQKKRKPA